MYGEGWGGGAGSDLSGELASNARCLNLEGGLTTTIGTSVDLNFVTTWDADLLQKTNVQTQV